jgi:hypothetical protein
MKLLNNIYSNILYASMSLYGLNTYANTCTVFQDSYSGYSVTMNSGEYISHLGHYMIERRTWHGYFNGWRGSDRNFNDEASSVILGNNCTLTIYEHIDRGGSVSKLINHAGGVNYRHFNDAGMNERASSLECNCGNNLSTLFATSGYLH